MEATALPEAEQTVVTPTKQRPPAWLSRADEFVAWAATLLIVLLHICLTPNVGGLWRDEVNTVNLATLPAWSDLWTFHNQDSFPLLFAALVRIWSTAFGSGDDSLRLLGLLIGLSVVAAFWLSGRLLGLRFPFWLLALVGANPLIIRYGDSMRAYGLGLALLLLMFGLVWKLSRVPRLKWFALASITSVLAVHAVYYNAVLLFAICMGGCAVAWREKEWRTALAVLAVGAISAASMLPYLPTFLHANDWNFLVQYPFTLPWMWTRLKELIGSPIPLAIFAWVALPIAALVVAATSMFRGRAATERNSERQLVVTFCVVALIIGVAAYTGFLKLLNYYTQVWYYVALITFVAACIDPILSPSKNVLHKLLRAAAVALFLAWTAPLSSQIIAKRHTNFDLLTDALHTLAAPEDLVLVTRWECGVTMKRYYKGPAPWNTVPPLTDFRFQAYQPVMQHMREEDPLRPIFEQVEQTLRSGHKVWLVGEAPVPPPNKPAPSLPRVVDPKSKWRGSPAFYSVWVMQVTHFLSSHQTGGAKLALDKFGPVSDFEDMPVQSVSGWK
jgi:hypothetical protein